MADHEQAVVGDTTKQDQTNDVDVARNVLEKAKQERVRKCTELITNILQQQQCTLASYQEFVNGIAKGPTQIIIVANG